MRNIDIDYMWENEIFPWVLEHENKYISNMKIHILCHIFLFLLTVVFMLAIIIPALGVTPKLGFYILFIIPNMIFSFFTFSMNIKYTKEIKQIYNIFLKPYDIVHSFANSQYYDIQDIVKTNIFDANDGVIDDIFTGKYKNIPYEIADIELRNTGRKHSRTEFEGLLLVINNFLSIADTITLYKANLKKQMPNFSIEIQNFLVKLENMKNFSATIIDHDKIYIFLSDYNLDFEIPKVGITKESFLTIVQQVLSVADRLEVLSLDKSYSSSQEHLIVANRLHCE